MLTSVQPHDRRPDSAERAASEGEHSFAAAYLHAATCLVGAAAGAVFLGDDDSAPWRLVAARGRGWPGEDADDAGALPAHAGAATVSDPNTASGDGYLERISAALQRGERPHVRVAELEALHPATFAGLAACGRRSVWHLPLCHAGVLLGHTALAFDSDAAPGDAAADSVASLARQFMLARASTAEPDRQQPPAAPDRAAPHTGGDDESQPLGISGAGALPGQPPLPTGRAEGQPAADPSHADDALRQALAGLSKGDDLQSFLEAMLAQALRAAGTGNGAVILLEGEAGSVQVNQIVVMLGGTVMPHDVKQRRGFGRAPLDGDLKTFADHVDASEGGFTHAPDDPVCPARFREFLEGTGVRTMYTMPLRVGGRLIGWFGVGYFDRRASNPDRLGLLRLLADQMTIAFEVTRLAGEAQHAAVAQEKAHAAQLRVGELVKANAELRRSLDLISDDADIDFTLGRMLQGASEQIACTDSTLCLRDEGTDVFRPELSFAGGEVRLEGARAPTAAPRCPATDHALWRTLIGERRAVVFDSAAALSDDMRAWGACGGIKTLLAVPLMRRGEVIGCLAFCFRESRAFSAEQFELLQTLAHQATLAVQLERLSKAAQSKSHRAATLAERARIARDLHDTLAQGLTGILMHLQAAQRTADSAQARRHVDEALDAARRALVDARRSVHALRSIAAERAEFVAALNGVLKAAFAGSSVATEVSGERDLAFLPESIESELLRIAQEAATNTLKHGRASRFDAWVVHVDGTVELHLQDDGVGFDTAVDREGFGLTGMEERAQRVGATLALASRHGAGTHITVSVSTRPNGFGHPPPVALAARPAAAG